MFIARLGAPEQRLVRTFDFLIDDDTVRVVLEYIAPETLNEEREKAQVRILGRRQYNALEDLTEQARELQSDWHRLLASRVVRVDGLTVRKLARLISMDPAAVGARAGGLDVDVLMDPADSTPVTLEERQRWDYPDAIGTRGQAAAENVRYLVNASARFRDFVHDTIQRVGLFQDQDWETQVKNSVTGAATNSATA